MVTIGIDRIEEAPYRFLLKDRRIGLVTNASGLSPRYGWRGTVEGMAPRYKGTALFAPEHGVRGVLGPGEKVSHGVDALSGIPTHSLFEDMVFAGADEASTDKAYMPAPESLREIDLLFFDMQDVGSRYFTYASTLFYTMRAAAAAGIPLVVADRPNPLGGEVVEGCRQDESCRSFIGLARVPIRHGLTLGELARYYNGAYGLGCDLTVIPMEALALRTLPADVLRRAALRISVGQELPPEELCRRLSDMGYAATSLCEGPGQFARRGGILDFYSPGDTEPVRIEYWGDDIDSMSRFDISTQRRTDHVDKCIILPAMESLPGLSPGGISSLCREIERFAANYAKKRNSESAATLAYGRGHDSQ